MQISQGGYWHRCLLLLLLVVVVRVRVRASRCADLILDLGSKSLSIEVLPDLPQSDWLSHSV